MRPHRILQSNDLADDLKDKVRAFLLQSFASGRNVSLNFDVSSFNEENETKLARAVESVAKKAQLGRGKEKRDDESSTLPNRISFPYSRHASYPELCLLVGAFKPKDVWPCTSHDMDWIQNGKRIVTTRIHCLLMSEQGISIQELFGKHCTGSVFSYDSKLAAFAEKLQEVKGDSDTQSTTTTKSEIGIRNSSPEHPSSDGPAPSQGIVIDLTNSESDDSQEDQLPTPKIESRKRSIDQFNEVEGLDSELRRDDSHLLDSQTSELSERALEIRRTAFNSMIENARDHDWRPVPLVSTWDHHTEEEEEL